MAKRSLTHATENQTKKSALDLAEEHLEIQSPKAEAQRTIPRSTDRISISLLAEERTALEDCAAAFRSKGRRDFKTSRLARIAFKMLLNASDDEVLQIAEEVPNLEKLRAKQL